MCVSVLAAQEINQLKTSHPNQTNSDPYRFYVNLFSLFPRPHGYKTSFLMQVPFFLTLSAVSSEYQELKHKESLVHSLPSLTPAPSLHPPSNPPYRSYRYSPLPSGEMYTTNKKEVKRYLANEPILGKHIIVDNANK